MDMTPRTKAIASAATGLAIAALAVGGFALARDASAPVADPALIASQTARADAATAAFPEPAGVDDLRSWEPRPAVEEVKAADAPRQAATGEQREAGASGIVEQVAAWIDDDDHHEDRDDHAESHEDRDDDHGEYEDGDDDGYEEHGDDEWEDD